MKYNKEEYFFLLLFNTIVGGDFNFAYSQLSMPNFKCSYLHNHNKLISNEN